MLCEMRLEVPVLLVAEPLDGFLLRAVVRGAIGQDDVAGFEKGPDPVVPKFAVHVSLIVEQDVEGLKGDLVAQGFCLQVLIEQAFPGGGMHDGGFGEDSVEIEEHRLELGRIDGWRMERLFSCCALCHPRSPLRVSLCVGTRNKW